MQYTYSHDDNLVHMIDELEKSEKGTARYRYIFKSVVHCMRIKNNRNEVVHPLLMLRLVRSDLRGRTLFAKLKYTVGLVRAIVTSVYRTFRDK